MADTLSPEDIALKFQEFDRQNSSTPPNTTVADTPQTDVAEKFRLYDQQQNRDTPTQDIAVASPSDIAEKFRQFDLSKDTPNYEEGIWSEDKKVFTPSLRQMDTPEKRQRIQEYFQANNPDVQLNIEAPNVKKRGIIETITPTATDIQEVGNMVGFAIQKALGDTTTQLQNVPTAKPETTSVPAKAVAAVIKTSNEALPWIIPMGPVMGAVAKVSPLLLRLVSLGFAADIGSKLPKEYKRITDAAEAGDEQEVIQGVSDFGASMFFGVGAGMRALSPGAAAESPLLARVLTKQVEKDISPEVFSEILLRVHTGEGTPAENELVKFMAKNKGVTSVTENEPRFDAPRFNKYMGLEPVNRNVPAADRATKIPEESGNAYRPKSGLISNTSENRWTVTSPDGNGLVNIEKRGDRFFLFENQSEVPKGSFDNFEEALSDAQSRVNPQTISTQQPATVQEQPAQEANQQVTPEAPTQVPQDVAGNRATTVIPVEQKLPFETVAPGEEIPESGAWVGRSVDYHFHDPEGRWPDKKSTGKIVSIFRGPNMESGRPRISVRIRWQNGTESEHGSSAGRGPSGIVNATQAVGAALKSGGVTIRDEPSPVEVPRTSPAESTPEVVSVQPEQSQPPTIQDSLTVQPPPEAVSISKELNRPLVQATGPDGQQYWFTFDGYNPEHPAIGPTTTLAQEKVLTAPGLTERGSYAIQTLEKKGWKFEPVPTFEQWVSKQDRTTMFAPAESSDPTLSQPNAVTEVNPVMDWKSVSNIGEDGRVFLDYKKLLDRLNDGTVKTHKSVGALLAYFLKQGGTHDNHPLKPIELLDISSLNVGFQGKFTETSGDRVAGIKVVTQTTSGKPLTQQKFIRILTHELAHNNITSKFRNAPYQLVNKANKLFEWSKDKARGTALENSNAFKNVNEFFADGLASKKIRNFLAGLNYKSNIGSIDMGRYDLPDIHPDYIRNSAFGEFLKIVKKVLGLPDFITNPWSQEKTESITALDELVSLSIELESVRRTPHQSIYDQYEFSPDASKRASLPIDTMPRDVTPSEPQVVTGVKEILDLLPKSGLDEKTQGVIKAFLATPVAQQLDLSKLRLEVKDLVDVGGKPAAGSFLDGVIELSRSSSDPETFVHEVGHLLFDMLSPADKALVRKWRVEELRRLYGNDAPAALESGNTTSAQFVQSGMPRADYHLSNDSEYFTHTFTEGFSKDHEADPEAQSFSQKVRAWLKALWDSVKQFFGADPTKEQFVRDILSGKRVTTPESGVKFEEKRASFRKTSKKAAADAKLAATKEIAEQTAKEQLAQTFDLVKTLEKNGVSKASKEAQKHLRYSDLAGISIEGEKGYGKPASYAELKKVSDEYQIAGMAQLGSAQFTRFKARQEAVEKKYQEKLKQVTSPQFIEKLAKLSESKLDMESKVTNEKHINITLETAVKQAQKAMREGKKSELEIERLQGEIDLMRSLQKQVPALDQAMRSVVDALASTPEGIEMLNAHEFPSRQDIYSIYKDIMGSAGKASKSMQSKRSIFSYEKSEGMHEAQTVKPQPWDIPIQADSIVKTAIYMLQRNEIVRDNVIAEHLMQDVGVVAQLPAYEAKLLADIKSSPAKTIMALRREGSRLATATEKAKFVYRTRHKPLAKELDEFEALQQASDIGHQTLRDPEFRATVSEMDKDANWVGEQGPLKPNIDTSVMLPNKERVDVSPAFFRGDMAAFQHNAAEMEKAVGTLKEWLLDPDNMNDRNYNSFLRTLAQLENNYIGVGMLDPNDRSKAVKYTFGILQNVVDKIAGRISIPARKALRKVDDAHRESAKWIQKWLHQWQVSRIEGMKSHKLEWGSLTSTSYNDQNKWYYENVFNPLADSWNQEGLQGYKVGQTMPNGEIVSKADMDHLALNSEAIRDSFRAMHRAGFDTTLELELGGHKMYRDPLQTSRNQTTHTFNRSRLQVGRDLNELKTQEVEALKDVKDEAEIAKIKDQFRQKQLEVLDKHWSDVGLDLMTGRSANYAKPTFVDGRDGALIALRDEARTIPSATAAIERLAGLTSKTVEEVSKEMVPEWSRIILNWHRPASANPSPRTMRAGDAENAFTRGREKTLAPGGFYDNGFRDARSVMNFASGMMSKATDEFMGALENARTELIALRSKMVSEAKLQGVSEKEITSMQRVVRDTGATTDFYDDIDSRIKEVEKTITNLSIKDLPADDPVVLDQAVAATLGLTLGTMTTVRNVLDGTNQIGRIGNQLSASWIASQSSAIWYGFLMSRIPFYLNLARTGAVAGVKFGYGPILATVKAIKDPSQRGWRQFGLNALEPVMKELAVNAFNWVPHYSEMQRLGIVAPPKLIEKELTARFLGSLLQQGRIAGRNLTTAQKVGLALMSPLELYRFANSQVNPALGDAHFNSAAFAYFKGSLSPIKMHEAENRKQAQLEKDGKRPFNDDNPSDPVNLLTYQELLPKTFYRMISSQQGLSDVLELYSKAGIDLQKEAFLQRQAIRNGGDRELLTEAQLASLIRQVHADINIATFSGSPAFSRAQNPTTKSLRGYFGWQVRTLSNILNRFAIPMQTKSGAKNEKEYRNVKAGKWLFVMTMFFLPFLIYSALYNAWNRIENRKLTKLLYNKDLPGRAPWERDGARSQAIGWTIEGLSSIPIIGTAIAAAMNDTSARASFDPNFIVLDHAKKILQWGAGVVQTGDLSYRTPELVMSLVPDSRIILSRLPGFEGKNDLGNAANLLRRYGPMDSMRPLAGPGSASVANELTPYGAKMANAAIKGDMQAFQEAYNEAVHVAKDLGKANPEHVVKEMFRSRNPYSTVFKRKLTEDERQQILAKASPEERQAIEQVEQRFSQAAASLGSSASFTSEQAASNRSSRSNSPYTSMSEGRTGGASGAGSGLSGSASTRRTGSRFGGIRSRGASRSRLGTRRRSMGGRVKSSLRIGKGMRSRTIKSSKRRSLSLASLR